MTKMKKRHILHWAMGVIMTPLLGSCAFDELHEIAGGGNGVLSFGVEVNAGAPEVKPMGGATRSGDRADSSATGNAVMSPDVDGFFPTSSVELSSVDGKNLYANCDERSGINMHNNVDYQITRGTIQTNDDFYSSFALYGYVYDSGKKWADANVGSSTNVDNNIDGIVMTKGSDNIWKASSVYWPGGSKNATFFAVAPKDCSGVTISADQGGPQITYTVPQEVSKQEDFLLAVAKDITCDGKNAPDPLTFNHALAAIKFKKGTLTGYSSISKVEISGVYNKGELSSFDNPAWTNQSIDGNTNKYSTSSLSDVMFLMPQTIPDGAKLKVTFSDGTNSKDFEADLKGTLWQAGHQYTYKLSVNKVTGTFNFEVSPSIASIAITGGTAEFTVKSYFQYQDNTIANIPWSGSYKIGETTTSVAGEGGKTGEKINIKIEKNESTSTHTQVLQNNPEKGSETSPYDLSTNGGASSMNTANCYVVNSKGTYSIPLVYGCAIKDGSENTISYGTGTYGDKTYSSGTFVNHAGIKITSPYINDMVSGSIFDAKLIWQEVKNMITNVELSSDKKSLIFTIGEQIAQGNAIVAYTVDDKVVWSWHIWVTDRNINATEKVTTKVSPSHDYDFMPVALGWVDSSEEVSPRLYTFNLTQSQSNKDLSATVNQAGETASGRTCPYYQWGRKDPLMPSKGIKDNTETKPCYDIDGNTLSFAANTSEKTIKGGILYPEKIINSSNANWDTGTTTYDNWNAINGKTQGFNYNEVVKTVYDPSPVGFKMPPPYAFAGFTDSGNSQASSSNTCIDKTNGYTNGFNEGYNFYTNSSKTTTTYWRACGYRAYNGGSLKYVGSNGNYWSAGPNSDTSGCYLLFHSSSLLPQRSSNRASGFSVRPVSE